MSGRYIDHPVGQDGWTDWIEPAQEYKARCCDCGLVHLFQYRVMNGRVQMKAKRDNRSTAASRAAHKRLEK